MASNDVAEALLFLDSIDLIDYTAVLLSVWNGSKTNISELLLWSLSEWLRWLINTSTGKNKLFEPTGAFKVYYTQSIQVQREPNNVECLRLTSSNNSHKLRINPLKIFKSRSWCVETTTLQEYSNWTFSLSLMSWIELDKQPSRQLTGSRLNNNNKLI